ncbi:putative transcriptional regulator [Anaerosolibacter carboniphilus]|uniref:Putative transcriptional regulator n=1 Tax=Anaerosolibacter carboniphilus TaxID=1417629 RepID=A0A841L318_9FIRM|nr:helix-turn-helix transcriptional regulator [Anaerosolibacter carboniphilus]MBB6217542.1 putative transcriptional regulator [Anaerosolibacter carboniphilus]
MNNIDSIRKKKALSYGDIAKESGLTPTYIHLLAKGKRNNPSLDVMQKISQALGEKVEKVFKIN